MPFENGVEWRPSDPGARGKYAKFADALAASVAGLSSERDAFFDSLADRWKTLFPALAARPGRVADGKIVLYVRSAPALFSVRGKLPAVKKVLASLPGAPKRIDLLLEIRK